ncbi:MAG: dTMP kinase [Alphaproteobacteria bacterium]|nr:dTMP kinase [Alphaproteobacteria bacterium]
MKKGFFISFEGGEGTGKSTQVRLLANKLAEQGNLVRITREPGGTELSEKIRDILKTTSNIDSITEMLLLFAARREHFIKSICPLLEQNYIVLCDRFYDSSLVYQGILKNVSIEKIMQLKEMTLGNFEPDFTIILDIPSSIAKKRIQGRQLYWDDYDMMSENEYNIIRNGFKKIAEIFPFRCKLIDASGNERKVFSKVQKAVEKFMSEAER